MAQTQLGRLRVVAHEHRWAFDIISDSPDGALTLFTVGDDDAPMEAEIISAELVRRWNAFEEGGAVRLAVAALADLERWDGVHTRRCDTYSDPPCPCDCEAPLYIRAALAALEGDAGTV